MCKQQSFKPCFKKLFVTCLVLVVMLMSSVAAASENITVNINGQPLVFQDAQPVMVGDRVLVPLRAIFEALGAAVSWDESTNTVMASKEQTFIVLQIDNPQAFVNNEPVQLDVPAQLIQERTMVPVRFIAQSLGANVNWVEETQTVEINQ